jgi:beta-phosphoglucomutase-like phosphatase (HAD superfamily)
MGVIEGNGKGIDLTDKCGVQDARLATKNFIHNMNWKTPTFSAVICDMDGLLLDTESIYRLAWQEAAGDQGYSISDELYMSLLGLRTEEAYEKLRCKFGNAFSSELFHIRSNHYCEDYVKSGVPQKSGLSLLLDFLNGYKIPRAIATSSTREKALSSLGEIVAQFDAIVSGDDVKEGKPAPDIFLAAARRLNVLPIRCIVLEDSPVGIEAANRAGMIPIMVPDLIKPSANIIQKAFCICNSLQDVIPLLRAGHNETIRMAPA